MALGRKEPGATAAVLALGSGLASGLVLWKFLRDHGTFRSVDEGHTSERPISELLRAVVAIGAGVAVVALIWRIAGFLLNASQEQKAANAAARAAAAQQARAEAAQKEADDAERRKQQRAEQLAPYEIGSADWTRVRFRHHVVDVQLETGVRWERRMWSDARTTKEREARAGMNRLRAEDRDLIAAETLRRRQKALTRAERSGGVIDWQTAERFVAVWMRQWFTNVRLTTSGSDEGIDVIGDGVVAQVKFEHSKAGRPAVQNLRGAAGRNTALFFAFEMSGYTSQAVAWAEDNDVALFTFDLDGTVEPANDVAEELNEGRREEEREKREVADRRRSIGRLTHDKAVGIVHDWLAADLPGHLSRTADTTPDAAVHLRGDRLAAAVCVSTTNEVGRPRLERLVAAADGSYAAFFVSTPRGLSEAAQLWADSNDIAVFGFDTAGRITPLNRRADAMMAAIRLQRG